MSRRLLVALGAVVAAGALVSLRRCELEPAAAAIAATAPTHFAAPALASLPGGTKAPAVRTRLAESPPHEPPSPRSTRAAPPAFEPYALRVRTVDELGGTVPLASVRVWPEHPGKEPLSEGLTDAGGRCLLRIDRKLCLLRATKDGSLDSGEIELWHETARAAPEHVLVLERLVPLSVLVLHADRTPAAGAFVVPRSNG
jgi:hypothetical protein